MISTRDPTRARRFVALLTLACGAWVHALALDCPMGLPANPSAEAPAHAAHTPDAHAAASDAPASADEDRSAPHSGPSCVLMMGCGATGQVAPRLAGNAVDAPTLSSRTLRGTSLYTTAFPAHEPPPPRLPV